MRFRLELFVEDVAASARFYSRALGFQVERLESGYAHLRRGDAELGLADVAMLPERDPTGGFTRSSVARAHGAGVEIVLEVEDLEQAAETVRTAGYAIADQPEDWPWGLQDFASPIPTAITCVSPPPRGS